MKEDSLISVPPSTHGENLIAEFPDKFPSPPELEPLLVQYALRLVSFVVYNGDPNILPGMMNAMASEWKPYSQGKLQFKFTLQGAEMSGPNDLGREDRCAFWASIGMIVPY